MSLEAPEKPMDLKHYLSFARETWDISVKSVVKLVHPSLTLCLKLSSVEAVIADSTQGQNI